MTRSPRPICTINGEPWWDFLYEYDMDGSTFTFHVRARSYADADARLKKIALARRVGQSDGDGIPLWRGGFLVLLIVWWRRWRERRDGRSQSARLWL